jgi:3-phosphoshikimate 1-carboxyvinyltransferase
MRSPGGFGMKFVAPTEVNGRVAAPPSKSMMGRAVAAALLTDGRSRIANASFCTDGLAALGIIRALGAQVEREEDETLTIIGTGKDRLDTGESPLDCNESGLCMRMFTPIAALLYKAVTLLGSGSLRSRPVGMVEELRVLGISCNSDHGRPPITVRGPLKGGAVTIDASLSSQMLTGLLMALPLCEEDSVISVLRLRSVPYVQMTIELLKRFGVRITHDNQLKEINVKGNQAYHPLTYHVEGDWSGASFLLVAGATSGSVTVTGLNVASAQADRAILEVLESVGALVGTGRDYVSVQKGRLKPFRYDATNCPDLFPPLVALASNCEGKSVIDGLDRLAYKESDRAHALLSEFAKIGIAITVAGNSMEVHGGKIQEAVVDSHNDHRIAMACAVAALRAEGNIGIIGEECVSKSYPDFFTDLDSLRGPV